MHDGFICSSQRTPVDEAISRDFVSLITWVTGAKRLKARCYVRSKVGSVWPLLVTRVFVALRGGCGTITPGNADVVLIGVRHIIFSRACSDWYTARCDCGRS
eukprot:5350226-Pyramimonas_sp.AAC.2